MESHFGVTQPTNNFEIKDFEPQDTSSNKVDLEENSPKEKTPVSRKEQALKIDTFIRDNYDITAHNLKEVPPNNEVKPHKAVFILLGDRHEEDTISKTNAQTVKMFYHLPSKKENQSSLSKVFTEGGGLEGHKSSQARYIDDKVEIQNWDTYPDTLLPVAASLRREVLDSAEDLMNTNMHFIENDMQNAAISDLTPNILSTKEKIKVCVQANDDFHLALETSSEGRNTTLGENVTQSWKQDQRKIIVIAGCSHLNLNDKNNPIRNLLINTGQPYIVLTPKGTNEKFKSDMQEFENKEKQKKDELIPLSREEQLDLLKQRIKTGIEKVQSMPTELVNQTGSKLMEVVSVLNDQREYFSIAKQIKTDALYQDFEETNQILQMLSNLDDQQNDEHIQ